MSGEQSWEQSGIWSGDRLDLDGYLARVGYPAGRDRLPSEENLHVLHRAHVLSLPFENVEPVLGRPVPLEVEDVQDKLVRRGRGGYCYEHVVLFAAALERFGFRVTGLAGRVRTGSERVMSATHALLRVGAPSEADGQDPDRVWLCDVGFGASPLTPVELADGAEASADDWAYRLEARVVPPGADGFVLHAWDVAGDCWFDRHGFTLAPQHPVDYRVGNHFIATHPRSPFSRRLYVQRVLPDRLHVLDGRTLTTYRPGDGSRTERELEPGQVPEALRELFGIALRDEDARLVEESGKKL